MCEGVYVWGMHYGVCMYEVCVRACVWRVGCMYGVVIYGVYEVYWHMGYVHAWDVCSV